MEDSLKDGSIYKETSLAYYTKKPRGMTFTGLLQIVLVAS